MGNQTAKVRGSETMLVANDRCCMQLSKFCLYIYNIYFILNVPVVSKVPILMLRPQAWDMVEYSIMATILCF